MAITLVSLTVLVQVTTAGASKRTWDWDGAARVELVHVDDLFSGGARQEDDGVRYDVRGAVEARVPGKLKLKPWLRANVERWRLLPARDLERWSGGLDVKRGPHRLRVHGGWTNDELFFPSPTGGASLDRRDVGAELRLGFGHGLLGAVSVERERESFNAFYRERDAVRLGLRTGLEYELGSGRTLALSHLYRRTDSVTDLYSYDHNSLRTRVEWPVAGWSTGAEAEAALRNYRTPHGYDVNHTRQDARWRLAGEVGHSVIPHLAASVFGEYRRDDSTRLGKDYHVTRLGIALEATR
ncbi:MAG: hypothetical protein ABIU54_05475 [Candidatus Eisenbacteria bacterium]